jgi:L-fuconolactonase
MGVEIVDVQLHVWEGDRPGRRWQQPPPDPNEAKTRRYMEENPVTYRAMAATMDAAGVTAAILATPGGLYGNDNSYAFDAAHAMPERFAVVARIDHQSPTMAQDLRDLMDTAGCVGVRMTVFTEQHLRDWRDGGYQAFFEAAATNGTVVCLYPPLLLGELPSLLRRVPGLRLVIDHLGVRQPPLLPADANWEDELPGLLALADETNVYVKLSGMHDLAREPYPFRDLADPLRRIVEAFGVERLMWGSDWTRSASSLRYGQTVSYLSEIGDLSQAQLERLVGGTLRECFGWT